MAVLNWRVIIEMRNDREAENRPVVVIYIEQKDFHITLICKNIGKGLAKNIHVEFDHDLKDDNDNSVKDILFAQTIPDMPPQYTLSTIITNNIRAFKRSDAQDLYRADISYESSSNKKYKECYCFKLISTPNKAFSLSNSYIIKQNIKEISYGIRRISEELRDIKLLNK
jgi:hypothetical protein